MTAADLNGLKPSNPKEAFGDAKMPLDLLPDTAVVQFNLAFLEGALKYGQYNWRVAGVKTSTYVRAARRHLSKFWNGQDADPLTLVHELASVGACVAILLDAIACGKLNDDRPPRADMEKALADAAKVAAHLKQLFANHNPPQYTERVHGASAVQAPGWHKDDMGLVRWNHSGKRELLGQRFCDDKACECHEAPFNPDEPPAALQKCGKRTEPDEWCEKPKGHDGRCR